MTTEVGDSVKAVTTTTGSTIMDLPFWSAVLAAFLSGVGTAHVWVLKRINRHSETLVGQSRDIKTAFNNIESIRRDSDKEFERLQKMNEDCLAMHRETLTLIGKVVDQNAILIHRHLDAT